MDARVPRRGPQRRAHRRRSAACSTAHTSSTGWRWIAELRWAIVQALSPRGAIDDDAIDAELERDPSAAGQRHAATARALAPTAEAKAEAWRLAVEDDSLPNAMQEAIIAGFAHSIQGELLDAVRRALLRRGAGRVAAADERGCPERRGRPVPDLDVDDHARARWLRPTSSWPATDLPAALRRLVSEGRADVARALQARAADAAASLPAAPEPT